MSVKSQLMMNGVSINANSAERSSDGALILNAAPMRSGDYDYYAFEISDAEERGFRWDAPLIGRIENESATETLAQFKGLPVTDDHEFVPVGERAEYACGTILGAGVMDGDLVRTEAVIHDPKTILKITNGDACELSIGFYSRIDWNENRQEGEPHFFVRDIDLNHVAVVKEGRAGPEARLSNHKASLKEDSEMEKITIDGVDYEVDPKVAQEFKALNTSKTELTNQLGTVTTERDTARGEMVSATAALTNAKKQADADAIKIANAHAGFVDQANKMGYDGDLVLGAYSEVKIMREVLNAAGTKLDDDMTDDEVRGAWKFAVANAEDAGDETSEVDDLNPAPQATKHSARESAEQSTHSAYFPPKKSKKKEA